MGDKFQEWVNAQNFRWWATDLREDALRAANVVEDAVNASQNLHAANQ